MVQHIIKWADDTHMTRTKPQSQTTRGERGSRAIARGPSCRPCSPPNHVHAELDAPFTPHTYLTPHQPLASATRTSPSSKHAKTGQVGTPPHETAPPPHSQSCWCSTIFGGSFHVGRLGSDDTFDGGSEHTGGPARPAAGGAAGRERSGDSERAMSAQGTPDRSVVGRPFFCHCAGVQHLMGGRLCVEDGGV